MKTIISIAQFETIPKEPELNLAKAKEFIIEAKARNSDLIVFPEMWTTGFQWDWIKTHAVKHNRIQDALANLAAKHKISILGSILHVDKEGRKTNRASFFDEKGVEFAKYDKTHLFSTMKEDIHLEPGNTLTTCHQNFGKCGLAICYDIRFPEIFRFYALNGVKIVFVMAAFPFPRDKPWVILNKARAIENQMFIVCANRVDTEDIPKVGHVTYCGHSGIIDPFGEFVIQAGSKEVLLTAEIDLSIVDSYRSSFPCLKDRQEGLYHKS